MPAAGMKRKIGALANGYCRWKMLLKRKKSRRETAPAKFYREETPRKGNGVSDAEHPQYIVRRKMFQEKSGRGTINSRYNRPRLCER
jgi:hypothetical protein